MGGALILVAIAIATLLAGNGAWLAARLGRVHISDWMACTWARVVLFFSGVSYEIRGRQRSVAIHREPRVGLRDQGRIQSP